MNIDITHYTPKLPPFTYEDSILNDVRCIIRTVNGQIGTGSDVNKIYCYDFLDNAFALVEPL